MEKMVNNNGNNTTHKVGDGVINTIISITILVTSMPLAIRHSVSIAIWYIKHPRLTVGSPRQMHTTVLLAGAVARPPEGMWNVRPLSSGNKERLKLIKYLRASPTLSLLASQSHK
jgi:hypothetical protein